jgi:hypothetical protein
MVFSIYLIPPPPLPPHVHIDSVVHPPGCGRSVTDFRGWGAHKEQLLFPDDLRDMYERRVPGGALNLNSTGYPDHGRYGGSSPARENSHGRTRNRTRDLMASTQKFWPPCQEAGRIILTFWHRNFFNFLVHPVYKMWIIQEPKKVALWNERHFEEKEMESVQHV